MIFKTHAVVDSNPEFKLRTSMHPVAVRAGVTGAMKLKLGRVEARVGEIPIRMVVPFLPGRAQTIGVIGAFGVHLEPVEGEIEGFDARFEGTVGTEGMGCSMEGSVGCSMEMDIAGSIPGRVRKAALEIAGSDDDESED